MATQLRTGLREEVVVLEGPEATEARVSALAPGRRVLHLATHGFFATDRCRSALAAGAGEAVGYDPMLLSGLVLAGEDRIWTAEEVAALDLRGTELVVLSACETGFGEARSGEGVLGLRRAFRLAGARSLVMTLWAVEDDATRQFMETLYERLRRRWDPVAALAAAQRDRIDRARHEGDPDPQRWAGFVVASVPTDGSR